MAKTWEETVKPAPDHSETETCPHCGEDFGIESRILYEREVQAKQTWGMKQESNQAPDRVEVAKAIYADWAVGDGPWEKTMQAEKEPWLKTADQIIVPLKRYQELRQELPIPADVGKVDEADEKESWYEMLGYKAGWRQDR